jgi:sporulation protein YabP
MTGVSEVLRLEESEVVLRTALGTAVIQGQELKLKTLSLEGGQMAVEGHICGITYEEPREGGLWQRLWR